METQAFSLDEYLEISRSLELHASIFFKLWDMGKPVFSSNVPTSAVLLDKENNMLNFAVNQDFWSNLTDYDKTFVIAHECMHVLLKHGTRGHLMTDKMVANASMDVAINHLLVNSFGFSRSLLSPGLEKKLCWVDTVFDGQSEIPPDNKAFEYYYELLRKMIKEQQSASNDQNGNGEGKEAIDDLSGLEEIEKWLEENQEQLGATKDDIDELQEKSNRSQSSEKNKKENNDDQKTGRSIGNEDAFSWITYPTEKVQTKNKWEKLFKEFNRNTHSDDDKEQWTRPSRRFVTLPSELMIPTENSDEHFKKEKIKISLFLDVSGSCRNLGPRFLKAARSISQKHFEIHACVFSTRVQEISLKSEHIPVGHGTKFACIEDYLRKQKSYPKYVLVFTDGNGGNLSPKLPQNWHWFLSADNRGYIPNQSKIYMLQGFE